MTQQYSSINHLILIIMMGCRQSYPERQFDTFIPMITGNIIVPFKHLPAAYLGLCWLCSFLFELPIDLSLLGCLLFSWVYMRLFMVTKAMSPSQIGDSTPAFALSTFFPERCAPWLDWLSKVTYKFFNMCKLIDGIQACIKKRQLAKAQQKAENRKKALKMLQREVSGKNDEEQVAEGWLCDEEEGQVRDVDDEDDDEESGKKSGKDPSKTDKANEATERKTSSNAEVAK